MDSPEQKTENKKAIKIFGLETLVIFILVIVILAILSFLNVIPLKSLFPFFTKSATPNTTKGYFDPVRAAQLTNAPKRPTVIPNLPADITVSSDSPAYTLSLQNKEKLITLLRNLEFFGRPYTQANKLYSKPIEKLNIILSPSNFSQKSQVTKDGDTVTSYKVDVMGNAVDFYVYVSPSILSENSEAQRRGGFAMSTVLRTLYNMSHDNVVTDNTARENELNRLLQEQIPKDYLLINTK